MGRTRFFKQKIDTRAIEGLAADLSKLSGEALGRATILAVNDVADRAYSSSVKGMRGINLEESYITSKMQVVHATDLVNPSAEIIARGDLTILGHFDPRQLAQSAPGAKGDPSRGIGAGQKQAGITVEVTRGKRKSFAKAFTMTLLGSGKTGVFIREGGRIKHLYGPSVYSLFRYQVEGSLEQIADDLLGSVSRRVDEAVQKAL
jgi:hypothetical protein